MKFFDKTMAKTATTYNQSVTISFDSHDKRAKKFIETLKMMDFFQVVDSPYDAKYVAEIKSMDEKTFKPIKREDIWK